ncbi:MAG: HlyC/CorC family transporter [Spirochaetes bacterium]|nr:HlyC/CorC family transporter [Spirochaetota bacterium]
MLELTLVITGLIAVSFLCSLLESVILSLSRPYIQVLVDRKRRSGTLLKKMKERIDSPIAAILTLNTISHTVGAAISGAIAVELFGVRWMGVFSAVLTLLILILSEIIPKTIGARFWKELSPPSAYILRFMILALTPLIIPINAISRLLTKGSIGDHVSKAEIYNFVRIGYHQGVLDQTELSLVENLFSLREVRVRDIMTPRPVVTWFSRESTVGDLRGEVASLRFSRIPLYDSGENHVTGVVLRRDIMDRIAGKKFNASLASLGAKPEFIPETMTVLKLLTWMVKERVQFAIVLNEFGDFVGIVTLEDAVETLLGMEIVDESDAVVDMRLLALEQNRTTLKNKKKKR